MRYSVHPEPPITNPQVGDAYVTEKGYIYRWIGNEWQYFASPAKEEPEITAESPEAFDKDSKSIYEKIEGFEQALERGEIERKSSRLDDFVKPIKISDKTKTLKYKKWEV